MSLFTDFENFSVFTPTEPATAVIEPMLDQLVSWTKAMQAVRAESSPRSTLRPGEALRGT